jgi:hypothetical protein
LRHAADGASTRALPTRFRPLEPRPKPRTFVWFTPALGLLLGGYLFFNKTFAYLHVPGTPVFVGEIVLAIGVVEVLLAPFPWRRLLAASSVLKIIVLFMAVCLVRFLTDFPTYGLDAIRDSSIAYYAAFAFLVAAAAVREPAFVPRLLGWYGRVLPAFLLWAPIAVVLSDVTALSKVVVPGTATGINTFKAGDYSVQIAMGVGYLWLGGSRAHGGRRPSRSRVIALSLIGLVGLLVCGTQTRGGFLAGIVVLAVVMAYLPSGRRRHLAFSVAGGLVVTIMVVLLLDLRLAGRDREFSLHELATNMSSVVQRDKSEELRGTVEWRQELWDRVRTNLVSSGAWVTGLGFGPGLGERFGVSRGDEVQPLRNVHNSHLTIFARAGVLGVGLWALLWLAWCHHLNRWIRRRPGGVRDPDGAIGAWLLAGGLGFLVNAYFDPSLEGPQACIWVYVLLGVGVALASGRRAVAVSPRGAPAQKRS